MSTLVWSDALKLDNPRMDATHVEFVDLLTRLENAPEDERLPRYRRLVAHTEEHFGQEDRWMRLTGFAPENCHQSQHRQVLQVLRAIERQLLDDQAAVDLRRLSGELAAWFEHHAQTMDAALAFHCAQVGFDTASETLRDPGAHAPAELITGCGSGSCA